jgi:NAD(P)H-flavin reductase
MIQQFTLIEKKALTHDVFELSFEWESELNIKPWQFITFILDKIGGRAYSVLKTKWKITTLIIKKRELDNWGRWWSKLICELDIWESLKWVWPAGHFTLKENNNNKLFIGTGTWLVPLYNQIIWSIEQKQDCNIMLVFWVRTIQDLFYVEQFKKIKREHSHFDFTILLSHESSGWYEKGYVTQFLTPENIQKFKEYYICWAPVMIDSTVEKLWELWVTEKYIFLERY